MLVFTMGMSMFTGALWGELVFAGGFSSVCKCFLGSLVGCVSVYRCPVMRVGVCR